MINLQCIFLVSLYSQVNINLLNSLIFLAGTHFICIIIYHIVSYTFGGVIRNKIELSISTASKLVKKLFNRDAQQLNFRMRMVHNIPEISYRYCEYQEPLVGLDWSNCDFIMHHVLYLYCIINIYTHYDLCSCCWIGVIYYFA